MTGVTGMPSQHASTVKKRSNIPKNIMFSQFNQVSPSDIFWDVDMVVRVFLWLVGWVKCGQPGGWHVSRGLQCKIILESGGFDPVTSR